MGIPFNAYESRWTEIKTDTDTRKCTLTVPTCMRLCGLCYNIKLIIHLS